MPEVKWAVAVATAPRKDCTLTLCVEHLKVCGWEPIIFAEPNSTQVDCLTIINEERKGVWYNWLNSAKWCLENTDADVIFTVQDDTILHPDSKTFAESCMWPAPDCGFLSLYTPKHYTITKTGQLKDPSVNRIWTKGLWGACALIFPRKVLEIAVETHIAKGWLGASPRSRNPAVYEMRRQNPTSVVNSDTAIGKIMNFMGRSMWFVDPSPGVHAAVHSTCGHGDNTGRRNAYRPADFSKPLTDQVPSKQKHVLQWNS
jgi:hypothetical protein